MQEKEKGFRDYFKETNNANYKITTHNSKQNQLNEKLAIVCKEGSNVDAIFVTTSKVYKVAEFIKSKKLKNIKIIG